MTDPYIQREMERAREEEADQERRWRDSLERRAEHSPHVTGARITPEDEPDLDEAA